MDPSNPQVCHACVWEELVEPYHPILQCQSSDLTPHHLRLLMQIPFDRKKFLAIQDVFQASMDQKATVVIQTKYQYCYYYLAPVAEALKLVVMVQRSPSSECS